MSREIVQANPSPSTQLPPIKPSHVPHQALNAPLEEARYLGANSLPAVESLVASSSSIAEEEEPEENAIDNEALEKETRQMDIPLDEEVSLHKERSLNSLKTRPRNSQSM